jgi:hypothetical protein
VERQGNQHCQRKHGDGFHGFQSVRTVAANSFLRKAVCFTLAAPMQRPSAMLGGIVLLPFFLLAWWLWHWLTQ